MAYEIEWSPEAYEDVDDIAEFIAKDSVFYAEAIVGKMLEAASSLDQMPERGNLVPELQLPEYREIFIYSYRLIYRVEVNTVLIVAAIHGKRLLNKIEERFDIEDQ